MISTAATRPPGGENLLHTYLLTTYLLAAYLDVFPMSQAGLTADNETTLDGINHRVKKILVKEKRPNLQNGGPRRRTDRCRSLGYPRTPSSAPDGGGNPSRRKRTSPVTAQFDWPAEWGKCC